MDKWISHNKILVNYIKTLCMLLGTRHICYQTDVFNLKIRDMRIDKVKNTTFLGINIDNELK